MKAYFGMPSGNDARVQQITERFNCILEQYQLESIKPYANDRDIYRQTTELAYKFGDNVLLLSIPDIWLKCDRDKLDCYLEQMIAVNLDLIRKCDGEINVKKI
jgi:hypothetical protein